MTDLYSNATIRNMAEKIVREDVIFCHSSLVSDLLNLAALGIETDDGPDYEDLLNVCSTLNYEEHARENVIPNMDRDDMKSWLDTNLVMEESESVHLLDAEIRAKILEALEKSEEWQEFCEEQRSEPDPTEAYEHWHVSSWLARRLGEMGEMTGNVYGMNIWGRTCSGQAISMDGVILRIAAALINEQNQRETKMNEGN